MFFHGLFDANRQYLNALNKTKVAMTTMIFTSVLHFGWCYLFVHIAGWDVTGVSMATFITFFLNFLIITTYSYHDKELEGMYFFFTKETF